VITDLVVTIIAVALVFMPALLGTTKKNKNKSCYGTCRGNCEFCYKKNKEE
jgi:hypothetical protein